MAGTDGHFRQNFLLRLAVLLKRVRGLPRGKRQHVGHGLPGWRLGRQKGRGEVKILDAHGVESSGHLGGSAALIWRAGILGGERGDAAVAAVEHQRLYRGAKRRHVAKAAAPGDAVWSTDARFAEPTFPACRM